MAQPLKEIYNRAFFNKFLFSLESVITIDKSLFLDQIFEAVWDKLELKQRIRHITFVLNRFLSKDFNQNIETILKLIPVLKSNGFKEDSLEFLFLPDFIETYGIGHYQKSISAIEVVTQFVTCEFAIRPFIINYFDKMIIQLTVWSSHPHSSVRRLASEGCRPRLPWGVALQSLKIDPSPILPILENLKADPSESVRRSVANNLNDISKDNPEIVINIIKKWMGKTLNVDALCKHASRTLLKKGNFEVLEIFGFGEVSKIKISDFTIHTPFVSLGDYLIFSFYLLNNHDKKLKIRLEYGIYYKKANGSLSKKVFQLSEKEYAKSSSSFIQRKQHFKEVTTRKLYPGHHQVALIINGVELEKHDFTLLK